MVRGHEIHWRFWLCAVLALAGCESAPKLPWVARGEAHAAKTREFRQRYQEEQDPDALNWLLHEHVENGMTLEEVIGALGSPGEPEPDAQEYRKGNLYHVTDEAHKWGPDRDGRSVVLFFRDGKLVNFEPNEFRAMAKFGE